MIDQQHALSSSAPGLPASLKHEMRTPLNQIIGYCEMLMEEASDTGREPLLQDLGRIHAAGRALLGVINDLFDPGKASTYRNNPSLLHHEVRTPLNQIIGYGEMLQDEAASAESGPLIADLGKITAAGRELLEKITLHFGSTWSAEPELKGLDGNSPPSRFPSLGGEPSSRSVILVVDDDAANRDMLRRRLTRLGHAVRLADNGRVALEMLREESFDLMLLDLQMPELNGYEVLAQIHDDELLREIPVIVMSSSDETSRVARCIEMGATDYLPKPFEPVLLRARIDACLEKKKLRDRERAAHEALERTQQHLARELAKAAAYVRSLLPPPLAGRVESEWCFEPSEQLGGDAFGYHWIDDDHLAIYLLDVCGHGVGAALLSVSVLNALRSQTLPGADFRNPATVLWALNSAFPAEAQNFLYFTMWYGVLCISTRELLYSSGGHPPALLLSGGKATPLATEGAAIGCFSDARFTIGICNMEAGARLLVFSDGVFEIFLDRDLVQTWDQFLASFREPPIFEMRAAERLRHARELRRAQVLEDDFSLLEFRVP